MLSHVYQEVEDLPAAVLRDLLGCSLLFLRGLLEHMGWFIQLAFQKTANFAPLALRYSKDRRFYLMRLLKTEGFFAHYLHFDH